MFREIRRRRTMIRSWARHDVEAYDAFSSCVERLSGRPLQVQRVLDVGCGANAPIPVLLSAAGVDVTGIDLTISARWGLGFRFGRYRELAGREGWMRTVRKLAGEAVFDARYYRELARASGLRLSDDGLDLREVDVASWRPPSQEFDVVHSNATWEHVSDVPAANQSVALALKPGGVAYIEIHLFPALSGGHDLPWIVPGRTELGEVVPWSHLRDPHWQPAVPLNRLRERDYLAAFRCTPSLKIEDWRTEFVEGQELLTDEVLRELPDYSSDELTKRSIIVVARRV